MASFADSNDALIERKAPQEELAEPKDAAAKALGVGGEGQFFLVAPKLVVMALRFESALEGGIMKGALGGFGLDAVVVVKDVFDGVERCDIAFLSGGFGVGDNLKFSCNEREVFFFAKGDDSEADDFVDAAA